MNITHLRVHSYYSMLRGTCSVETLVERAVQDELSALALTDEGVLYGVVRFSRACRAAGIKPIIGLTVQVAAPDDSRLVDKDSVGGTLVLLATGSDGYRSLCRLSSRLMAGERGEPNPRRPLDWNDLVENHAGLIVIDSGKSGCLAKFLHAGNELLAANYLSRFGGSFGDNAFLGVDLHQVRDPASLDDVTSLASRFGLPLVACHPVYSTQKDMHSVYRLGTAIERNIRLDEVRPEWTPGEDDPALDQGWRDPQELHRDFAGVSTALETTAEIADRCGDCLPSGKPIWPVLSLPQDRSPEEDLATQAVQGLSKRYPESLRNKARERLDLELEAINLHGFAPLFIVVADITRFAREKAIPYSTRGSIANSLTAYCLQITTIDPLTHDLLFERFLNPARTSLPDIDLDFCSRRRDEILEYVRRTYGEDRVALVGTVSTMRPKSAVRLTAKAMGFPDEELAPILERLPGGWHPDPRRRDNRKLYEILGQFRGRARELVSSAAEFVGKPHHLSVHPGGVIICPGPATDIVPLQMAPKGFLITQYDHHDVEAIGLPKLDLLGIRALTVLSEAMDSIRQKQPDFSLDDIVEGDSLTEAILSKGETIGVFQCESEGARRTLRKLRARSIPDLAVANAFFKPGPATGGMAKAFVRRYRGEEAVSYLHPSLEPILQHSKGVLLFQEQILRVATEIAGLSWAQAERLRKGMSKFRPEEMQALQSQFIQGCRRQPPDGPGFTEKQAETLWTQVEAFAGYGFNQGHALAYAGVSYRSAYLKAHWPMEFLAARLANYGGYHHPAVYAAEAQRLGFSVKPPHVNHSNRRFTVAAINGQTALFTGLSWVRDLRRATQLAIIRESQAAPFLDLRDFLSRVEVMDKEIQNLVRVGAFDGLGPGRASLLSELKGIQRAGNPLQTSFGFFDQAEILRDEPRQILAWEKELLGMPVSIHPLAAIDGAIDEVTPISALENYDGGAVRVTGARLPGWGGGSQGFLFSDRSGFIQVHLDQSRKPRSARISAWTPLLLEGQWRLDPWGGGWLEVDRFEILH